MSPKKKLWKSLSVAALLSSCATTIPDVEVASGVQGYAAVGVAALARNTNSDNKRRMDVQEWLDFLYAQPKRPDWRDKDCLVDPQSKNCTWLPEKGPAVCMSSEDYQRNDAAIAQICVNAPCSYELKKNIEEARTRVNLLIKEAKGK